jgi:hypothetical protein
MLPAMLVHQPHGAFTDFRRKPGSLGYDSNLTLWSLRESVAIHYRLFAILPVETADDSIVDRDGARVVVGSL